MCERCVLEDQSCGNFLFVQKSRHLTTELTINFAWELRDELWALNELRLLGEATFREVAHSVKM